MSYNVKHSNHKGCKSCGFHESACKCHKKKPLPKDCTIIDSVVCSKTVQKVAQVDIALEEFDPVDVDIVNGVLTPAVNVIIDEGRIDQNIILIKDKVVNIGAVPITITVGGTPLAEFTDANVVFQEETDLPGVCPGDTVRESPFQIEAVIIQPIPNVIVEVGEDVDDIVRIKIILRTTITVTRQVMIDKDGNKCDVNERRCEPTTTPIFNLPVPPLLPM